jgi:hypothetical protein
MTEAEMDGMGLARYWRMIVGIGGARGIPDGQATAAGEA